MGGMGWGLGAKEVLPGGRKSMRRGEAWTGMKAGSRFVPGHAWRLNYKAGLRPVSAFYIKDQSFLRLVWRVTVYAASTGVRIFLGPW